MPFKLQKKSFKVREIKVAATNDYFRYWFVFDYFFDLFLFIQERLKVVFVQSTDQSRNILHLPL